MHTEHERCGTNNILQRLYETTHLRMNPAFSLLGLLGSALHMLLTLQTVSSATCLKHPPSRHPPRSRVLDRKGNPLYRSRSCTENRDHNHKASGKTVYSSSLFYSAVRLSIFIRAYTHPFADIRFYLRG